MMKNEIQVRTYKSDAMPSELDLGNIAMSSPAGLEFNGNTNIYGY